MKRTRGEKQFWDAYGSAWDGSAGTILGLVIILNSRVAKLERIAEQLRAKPKRKRKGKR